jgi:hypothetical protein
LSDALNILKKMSESLEKATGVPSSIKEETTSISVTPTSAEAEAANEPTHE